MPDTRDDNGHRTFDDDRWNKKNDDTYDKVMDHCLPDADDNSATCWSNFNCEWLHKLDPNYKCNYEGKIYCCTNNTDLCCEPDQKWASIAACTLFATICILLKLVIRFGRKNTPEGSLQSSKYHQGFQILTEQTGSHSLNEALKDSVMSTGFD